MNIRSARLQQQLLGRDAEITALRRELRVRNSYSHFSSEYRLGGATLAVDVGGYISVTIICNEVHQDSVCSN